MVKPSGDEQSKGIQMFDFEQNLVSTPDDSFFSPAIKGKEGF